jgi:soluble lytic murein transglycosylase
MTSTHGKRPTLKRASIVAALCAFFASAVVAPFASVSCASRQGAKADDPAAAERLRAMTRGGALPAESVVAALAKEYGGTRTGALARIAHARVKAQAGDHAGAASLLDSRDLRQHTVIADHALFLRGEFFEKAGRRVEARAAFEQLARDYPLSTRARAATLRAATLTLQDGQPAAVPVFVKKLADADDTAALLLTAKGYEQSGDATRALGAYRRLYFYAPSSEDAEREAAQAIARLNSTNAPASAEEAITRAEKLSAAKRYGPAVDAFADAFARFPQTADAQARLGAIVAASNAKRPVEAANFFNGALVSEADLRAEQQYHLARTYLRAKRWPDLRAVVEDMGRAAPKSRWTMLALVEAGAAAKEAKNTTDAFYFYRAAVSSFPGAAEVAGAQFELAWAAHEAKNFAESSRLLIEHLAAYADRNTDNRGKAGYWAARDSERAGRTAEARALYEAMLVRYEANWYGQLSQKRLEAMSRAGQTQAANFASDSPVARAAANLSPVFVAEERAGPAADEAIKRADELNVVGLDELAHAELDRELESAPASPRINLAKARIHRHRGENLEAFRTLARSFPDYSQMEVGELTPAQWDAFYPLAHWDIIVEESRAKSLDPYTVAGLIRQESVFNPRAASHADAYGLMQLIMPTARAMARRSGVSLPASNYDAIQALFDPRANIKLGTLYLRDNLDKFGRIEYVAAAYNAGPGRAVTWRATLPAEMDEWAEAVPFRETKQYVQGVARNTLQYRRLYDEQGRFRPEVGSSAVTEGRGGEHVRPRRVSNDEEEE